MAETNDSPVESGGEDRAPLDPVSLRPTAFRRGAVAFVDALGFKGIWNDPEKPDLDVLRTLDLVRIAVREAEEALRGTFARLPEGFKTNQPQVETHFMSDTVIVAASLPDRDYADVPEQQLPFDTADEGERMTQSARRDALDDMVRLVVCECLGHAMKAAAGGPRPLAYRGVVCLGRFVINKPFVIGPATDEAASLMDLAEGAFVWLAPSALRAPWRFHIAHERSQQVAGRLRFPVPIKGGQTYLTECLSPSAACDTVEDARLTRMAILRTMRSSRLDVEIKRQNTGKFFQRIKDHEDYLLRKAARDAEKRAAKS